MVIGQYRAHDPKRKHRSFEARDHRASRIRALPTARHDQLQLFESVFRPAPTFTETIAIKTDVFEIGDVSAGSKLGSNLPALCRSISGLSGAESAECSTIGLPGIISILC